MCWGLFLAAEDEPPGAAADAGELMVWPEANAWIDLALGPTYRCWILGHARHCSCGCVRPHASRTSVSLHPDAGKFLADAADALGHVVIAAKYCPAGFVDEELPFTITGTMTSRELRGDPYPPLTVETFVWVQGHR